jgi:hypothetical protein
MTTNSHRSRIALKVVTTLTAVLMAVAWTAQAKNDSVDATPPARSNPAELEKYTEKVDRSVDKALHWLAKQQIESQTQSKKWNTNLFGSFPAETSPSAVTGLVGMAFLAKGYTPEQPPYGRVLNRAIDFVISQVNDDGYTKDHRGQGRMYAHSICTLFLSEVSGMVSPERQKRIDDVLPKMIRIIVAAHRVKKPDKHAGGWRYSPNSKDSDLSLTGWAFMALRSARLNGTPIPYEQVEDTVKYIMKCRGRDGGFCYQPSQRGTSNMTAVGVLCLELSGQHRTKVNLMGGNFLLKDLRRQKDKLKDNRFFHYGVYYISQAMFQLGDDYWVPWAKEMYPYMLRTQNEDGSWKSKERREGSCYATAMHVLSLAVSYRQLPIYQRDEPLGKEHRTDVR